jgi:uncharacterized protein YozE (UPF0346 family)
MHSKSTPSQIEQCRRDAKRLARQENIPLHEAQGRVAQGMGFRNWSLFAKGGTNNRPAKVISTPSPKPTKRYYLHGDQDETDSTRYYCKECDAFFGTDHFARLHRVDHGERALSAIERFQRAPENFGSRIHRPKDAPNILSAVIAATRAEREAKEAARSSFHRWLEKQKGRGDPVGDLAYDVIHDEKFPSDTPTQASAKRYLVGRRASSEALEALADAWQEFETSR